MRATARYSDGSSMEKKVDWYADPGDFNTPGAVQHAAVLPHNAHRHFPVLRPHRIAARLQRHHMALFLLKRPRRTGVEDIEPVPDHMELRRLGQQSYLCG